MLAADGAAFQKLDAVVVIHPRNLSEQTLAALDRYVVGGGKLVVFQDPAFMADPLAGAPAAPTRPGRTHRISTACFPPGAARCRRTGSPQTRELPPGPPGPDPASARPATLLALKGNAIHHADGLNAGVTRVRVFNAGTLQIKAVPGITATPFCNHPSGLHRPNGQPAAKGSRRKGRPLPGCSSHGNLPQRPGGGSGNRCPESCRTCRDKAPGRQSRRAVVVFSDVDMLTGPLAAPESATALAGGNADLVLSTMESLTGSVSLASIKARGK